MRHYSYYPVHVQIHNEYKDHLYPHDRQLLVLREQRLVPEKQFNISGVSTNLSDCTHV